MILARSSISKEQGSRESEQEDHTRDEERSPVHGRGWHGTGIVRGTGSGRPGTRAGVASARTSSVLRPVSLQTRARSGAGSHVLSVDG